MTTSVKHESRQNREWLRRMADAEDRCESVAVGGLAHDLGMLRRAGPEPLRVFGRFIEFARRARALSVEKLAAAADVDLAELVAIERDEDVTPTPRTVYQLARLLGLSTGKFMELAGLAEPKDQKLRQAALEFAARSEPTTKLSNAEREALEKFVQVLVEASDGG